MKICVATDGRVLYEGPPKTGDWTATWSSSPPPIHDRDDSGPQYHTLSWFGMATVPVPTVVTSGANPRQFGLR